MYIKKNKRNERMQREKKNKKIKKINNSARGKPPSAGKAAYTCISLFSMRSNKFFRINNNIFHYSDSPCVIYTHIGCERVYLLCVRFSTSETSLHFDVVSSVNKSIFNFSRVSDAIRNG